MSPAAAGRHPRRVTREWVLAGAVVTFLSVALAGAGCSRREVATPATRDAAWWWWPSPTAPQPGPEVPLAYVHAGTLDDLERSDWPMPVPPARRYVLVWRSERRAPPRDAVVRPLVAAFTRVSEAAHAAGATVIGMQVDVDVPTSALRSYAGWLGTLRRALPHGATLSVTGLLDWFRAGTGIERIADAVDELVPQFYDLVPSGSAPGIAHPVDLATWTPRLDALRRPYRIGLATFGRIERVEGTGNHATRVAFRDLTPLDLAERFRRHADVVTTAGGERMVTYTDPAAGATGRTFQLVVPPADVVEVGHALMAACGRWCAGVAFFRWPAVAESLVVGPAPGPGARQREPMTLDVTPADCAPLWCADVSIVSSPRFPDTDATVTIVSSEPLRLVHEAGAGRNVVVSRSAIAVRIPAWHGRDRVSVGRLFTDRPARITLDAPASPAAFHAPPPRH